MLPCPLEASSFAPPARQCTVKVTIHQCKNENPNPRVGGCLCRPTKGAGRARPVNRGGGGWGEVAEYCKIFHPLGGKIAGFFPLCAKFPSLRPPPRPCCSNWIPSRLKKP